MHVEFGLRVDCRWSGSSTSPLRLAHRVSRAFPCWAASSEPLARGRAEAPDHLIDVLHVLGERAAMTVLSAPSSTISPSFCSATAAGLLHFLVRSLSAASLRAASSAGPWLARLALCADSCRLAARRGYPGRSDRPWSRQSRPSIRPAPARKRAIAHAGDGQRAAPIWSRPGRQRRITLKPNGLDSAARFAPLSRLRYLEMTFPSRGMYPCTPINGSLEAGGFSAAFLTADCLLLLTDFPREPENGRTKGKGRHEAGLPQVAVARCLQ